MKRIAPLLVLVALWAACSSASAQQPTPTIPANETPAPSPTPVAPPTEPTLPADPGPTTHQRAIIPGLVSGGAPNQPPDAPLQPAPWAAPPVPHLPIPAPGVDALAVLVLDEASGRVLHEENARTALPPASLTKIATAAVALEQADLGATHTVDIDARDMPGSSVMGLRPGDSFTMRDLLYGVMLPSGNDASIAVARALAGSEPAFVEQMNALVRRLGLQDTNFVNTHGLTAAGHIASAYDLGVLARYAMSVDGFAPIVSTEQWTAIGSRTIELTSVNRMGNIDGVDGVKVGFTNTAGRTIVASATRDGRRLYAVLLNAPESRRDAGLLLDWAFLTHTWPD